MYQYTVYALWMTEAYKINEGVTAIYNSFASLTRHKLLLLVHISDMPLSYMINVFYVSKSHIYIYLVCVCMYAPLVRMVVIMVIFLILLNFMKVVIYSILHKTFRYYTPLNLAMASMQMLNRLTKHWDNMSTQPFWTENAMLPPFWPSVCVYMWDQVGWMFTDHRDGLSSSGF